MAACDVLLLPFKENEWIKACNPVKLKEYLAVGRPVVSTPFGELCRYEGFVTVASGSEEFAQAIQDCLADRPNPELLRDRVRKETWAAKADNLVSVLSETIDGIVSETAAPETTTFSSRRCKAEPSSECE